MFVCTIFLIPHICINIQYLFFSSNLLHSVWQSLDSSQINGKPWAVVTSGRCRFPLVRWPACVRQQEKKKKPLFPRVCLAERELLLPSLMGKQEGSTWGISSRSSRSPEVLIGLHAREAQLRPLGAMEFYTLTQTSRILPRLQSPVLAQPPLTPGRAWESQLSYFAHLQVQEPCTWDSH